MFHFVAFIMLALFFAVYGEKTTTYRRLPTNCGGTRYDNMNTRIVGGSKARLGQFPWMARIGIREENKETWFYCGGSLINKYYVLSAAHCEEIGNIVRLGESDTKRPIDCDNFGVCAPPHQDIRIKNYRFANYCRTINDNDIMLIELDTPALLNDFVQPICLPTTDIPINLANKYLVLSGWGAVDGLNPLQTSTDLMYIIVQAIDFETCKRLFPQATINRQICISQSSDGRNACNGDSGGSAAGIMKVNGVSKMYLFGIASYVQANCKGGAVYTDVKYYMDFILDGIKKS